MKRSIGLLISFLVMSCNHHCNYASESQEKLVVIFGCFDLFHEGHKNFIQQASAYGKVIALVTRDSILEKLKKRSPCQAQEIRLKNMQEFAEIYLAILGDEKMGTYEVLQKYKPNLICLGYDQHGLFNDLQKRMSNGQLQKIPMLFMQPHQENVYHTSIIREQLKL